LGEDFYAVDGVVDRAGEMAKRAVGSVSEPGEEGSQLRIADRIGQRTGEAFSAEYLDVPGMKAARSGVDRLSQTKPVRGVGKVTGRGAQRYFVFPPLRGAERTA
jgi:hypothetical protein